MYVFPDSLLSNIILALETEVALFPAGMVLRLYTNDLTPTKANVIGDFTELTAVQVPGYAPVAPAWDGAPLRKQDGSWEDISGSATFQATGGPPPIAVVCYGWFLTNAAGTVLHGSGRMSVPFTFTADGDGITLEMQVNLVQVDGSGYTLKLDMEEE